MICRFTVLSACAAALAAGGVALAEPSAGSTGMSPVDYAFIGSTSLGNVYQIDTGKLGETRAADPAVKNYAQLMDTSHVDVENALMSLLKKKGLKQPTLTLIQGSYQTIVRMLSNEKGATFDHDYIEGQVDYQRANDALYRWEIANGKDADLVAYAKTVLPKIDDHKDRAEKLAIANK